MTLQATTPEIDDRAQIRDAAMYWMTGICAAPLLLLFWISWSAVLQISGVLALVLAAGILLAWHIRPLRQPLFVAGPQAPRYPLEVYAMVVGFIVSAGICFWLA